MLLVSFYLDSEISVTCFGKGYQVAAEGVTDGVMQMAGQQNYIRCATFESCASIFVNSDGVFSVICDENAEKRKCRVLNEKVSGIEEEVLGNTHMGETVSL